MAKSATLVSRTARELVRLSLEREEGEFLGAEEELLQRLGVSRPTLRQAAKIAENDRFISVRRGIRGGFYASRPNVDDATRSLARYLRLQGVTLLDVVTVNRPVSEEAAALACACEDEELRARLERLMADIETADTVADIVDREQQLSDLIAEMSENPIISVFMGITFSFGLEEDRVRLFRDPDHRAQARRMMQSVCRAILERDADIARLMVRRRSTTIGEWVKDNAQARQAGQASRAIR
ncbi:MAG: FCD domain-containing protein [Novosphingobium sp.]|nr:FCD domain-containing protein [Novosphingobium sp.]